MAAFVVASLAASSTGVGPAGAGVPPDPGTVAYAPPVEAPVTDPFRPPPQPWLPGNRGIEYATVPGTPVRSAGRGVVSFAGPVAGTLHVTVSHPDGIRTSYSYLTEIRVAVGQAVAGDTVVGTSGSRLHVGARRGPAYIDPASLWAAGPPRVRLVPVGDGAPRALAGDRDGRTVRSGGEGSASLVVDGRLLPRLFRRSGHRGRARSPPLSSAHQRSPSGVRVRVTSNRWERRTTWISPS